MDDYPVIGVTRTSYYKIRYFVHLEGDGMNDSPRFAIIEIIPVNETLKDGWTYDDSKNEIRLSARDYHYKGFLREMAKKFLDSSGHHPRYYDEQYVRLEALMEWEPLLLSALTTAQSLKKMHYSFNHFIYRFLIKFEEMTEEERLTEERIARNI